MEIKPVGDYLYKSDGEFSVLYDSIKEVNKSFSLLLNVKEAKSKEEVTKTMIDVMKKMNKDITEKEILGIEQLMDALVHIIFKDIKQCHQKIYC